MKSNLVIRNRNLMMRLLCIAAVFVFVSISLTTVAGDGIEMKHVAVKPGDDLYTLIQNAQEHTTFNLAPGDYELAQAIEIREKNEIWIVGQNGTNIYALQPYERVVNIANSTSINIKNVFMTHKVERGNCDAPVIDIRESSFVEITDCHLDGSGTYAIRAKHSEYVTMSGGEASHNTEGVFVFEDCKNVRVIGVNITNNDNVNWGPNPSSRFGMGIINVASCINVEFSNNGVHANQNKYYKEVIETMGFVEKDNQVMDDNAWAWPDGKNPNEDEDAMSESVEVDYCYTVNVEQGYMTFTFTVVNNEHVEGEIYSKENANNPDEPELMVPFTGTVYQGMLKIQVYDEAEQDFVTMDFTFKDNILRDEDGAYMDCSK